MEVLTHKCPNCGGPLTFDPKDQKFHCDYCLSIFTEEEVSEYEKKQEEARTVGATEKPDAGNAGAFTFTAEEQLSEMSAEEKAAAEEAGILSEEAPSETMDLFLCPNCGAEIVTDQTTAATYCYYCHNPVVLSGRLSGAFLPDKVLPFMIEKDEAVNKFLAWTKKKWFVPKAFFNKEQIEKLTGVYFPYWATDAKVNGSLSARGTVLRVWRVGDIEYTETKQFDVGRNGEISFKELVKNALSKNVQQKMVEGVQPFQLDKAVDFKSQYLSGFQAEKRDIEYEALKNELENELKDYSETLLEDTASGYHLSNVQTSISIDSQEKHYLLLPVWLVTYRSSEKSKKVYYYAMNGQTGKVSGVLPVSKKKLGFTALGIFTALAVLFLIGGYFI
ncbi:hypothetical protein D920_01417 [Enterococcus faecalis 13-SD-W-01]|nr:hypothetical protein D920_01417 [Enterococcus faecalis 13-SD-W-01]